MINKVPACEGGALKLLQIHLKRAQNLGFFYFKGEKRGLQQGPKKKCEISKSLFFGPLAPADVIPGLRLLQTFAKSSSLKKSFVNN